MALQPDLVAALPTLPLLLSVPVAYWGAGASRRPAGEAARAVVAAVFIVAYIISHHPELS